MGLAPTLYFKGGGVRGDRVVEEETGGSVTVSSSLPWSCPPAQVWNWWHFPLLSARKGLTGSVCTP